MAKSKEGKRTDSKRRILKTGEYERPDGMYVFRTTYEGKRHTIYATTLDELREKKEKLLNDLEQGLDVEKQKLSLNDIAKTLLCRAMCSCDESSGEFQNSSGTSEGSESGKVRD